MAFKCGFFNSINGDRRYSAEDMNNPYSMVVSDGVFAQANGNLSTDFQVQIYSGLKIKVKEGKGIFAGKWGILDSDMIFTVPTPNVNYTRIDSVVVRIDKSSKVRKGSIEYLQGTAAENPVPPTITRTAEIMDFRLANITVHANANAITASNIADRRPYSECGIVTNLLQNSDISATFSQWQAQFSDLLSSKQNDYNNFVSGEKEKYNSWTTGKQTEYNEWTEEQQTEYDNYINAKKSEYDNYINTKESEYDNYINTKKSEFERWLENKQSEFETWFAEKQASLNDITPLQTFSNYIIVGESDNKKTIPINLDVFNMQSDILQVYVNGMLLAPEVEYTINGFESVTLSKAIDEGTSVLFIVFKTNGANTDPDYIEAQWNNIKEEE